MPVADRRHPKFASWHWHRLPRIMQPNKSPRRILCRVTLLQQIAQRRIANAYSPWSVGKAKSPVHAQILLQHNCGSITKAVAIGRVVAYAREIRLDLHAANVVIG